MRSVQGTDLDCQPLFTIDPALIKPLLSEEQAEWLNYLDWDNRAVQDLLLQFISLRTLPGYAIVNDGKIIGYCYYMLHGKTALIGSLYVSEPFRTGDNIDALLATTVETIKAAPAITRIETQIFPFGGDLKQPFLEQGFEFYQRHYLCRSLSNAVLTSESRRFDDISIEPWNDQFLDGAARVVHAGYERSIDAVICSGYRTIDNCGVFIRNLVSNPGCGIFSPWASFVALDPNTKNVCGAIVASAVSQSTAFIPQVSVDPHNQAHGIGSRLMFESMSRFRQHNFQRVCLSVTENNTTAYAWYKKLGFEVKHPLYAFVWEEGSK